MLLKFNFLSCISPMEIFEINLSWRIFKMKSSLCQLSSPPKNNVPLLIYFDMKERQSNTPHFYNIT